MKKTLLAFLLLLSCAVVYAQPVTLPFEHTLRIEHERSLVKEGSNWHPVYPFRINTGDKHPAYADLYRSAPGRSNRTLKGWLNRKMFYEPFITVDTGGLRLFIDPMIYGEIGKELTADKTSVNTRGVRVDGTIGRQFAFHTAFFESQAFFPSWVSVQSKALAVVPGQAMYKSFKDTGFDYAFAEGHISYSPSGYFNFRFGHGKNFIGDGYRSLLLSDVAFNYPYLAINTRVWNIEYVNIFSQLQDIRAPKGPWQPWKKKYTTTHYLSWNVLPWLNIGLFESIVWHASDSTGNRGFDLNYLNPVIFYRPVEFSLGSPDNALLGGSMRFRILKNNFLYLQLMLDEFKLEHVIKGDGWWANKHGFQTGVKSYDAFGVPHLYLQAEYNHVRPYTYAHHTHLQNYAHYNQPLAHPQGANFRELVLIGNQRLNRWQLGYKFVYTTYGADSAGINFGHDLFRSYYDYAFEFGNKIGQGVKTTMMQQDISIGWVMNPATNLVVNAGATLRQTKAGKEKNEGIHLWFGIRSAVFNRYYDF